MSRTIVDQQRRIGSERSARSITKVERDAGRENCEASVVRRSVRLQRIACQILYTAQQEVADSGDRSGTVDEDRRVASQSRDDIREPAIVNRRQDSSGDLQRSKTR